MPIDFVHLSFVYNSKSPFQSPALMDINLSLKDSKFIAIVGRTGSGKTTLVQNINALLVPNEGYVRIGDFFNAPKKAPKLPKAITEEEKEKNKALKASYKKIYHSPKAKELKAFRKEVGLVFQFPEYQLFEETVEKDVAFGPKNFGYKKKEAYQLAHEALLKVGLDESFFLRSPFELSGGEKRKVAIAGILAIAPKILIVDEPTAGLDPAAAKETMDLFKRINEEGATVILVTHDMDLVARYADEVIVMDNGKVTSHLAPHKLFGQDLTKYSLQNPHIFDFASRLEKRGFKLDTANLKSVDDLAMAIVKGVHHG